jgi:hypothetical protein
LGELKEMETGERKRCDEELMQMFGNLDIFLFAKISLLNWIGYVNRTDVK